MKRLTTILFILLAINSFAEFHYGLCHDTVYLKNSIIVGKIQDFDNKQIIITDLNQNTQKIRLTKVQGATLYCFDLPAGLHKDTIIINNRTFTGYKLFFNPFSGDVLFVDYQGKRIIKQPFYLVQNDPSLQAKLKFYKYNSANSLFLLLMSGLSVAVKYLLDVQVYLIASALLAAMAVLGCIVFCRPLIKRRKYLKSLK